MRNLLAFLGAAILVFLGVGWYLGWYKVLTEPAGNGHSKIQVDIDKDKIGKDVKAGAEKVQETIEKNAPKSDGPKDKTQSNALTPSSPFTPLDPSTLIPDEKKKAIAENLVKDLLKDGWSGSDKK